MERPPPKWVLNPNSTTSRDKLKTSGVGLVLLGDDFPEFLFGDVGEVGVDDVQDLPIFKKPSASCS